MMYKILILEKKIDKIVEGQYQENQTLKKEVLLLKRE